jgi:hypothetical protein
MSDDPELPSSKLSYDDPDLPNVLLQEEMASWPNQQTQLEKFDIPAWEAEGKWISGLETDMRWQLGKWLNEGYAVIGDWCIEPTMGNAGISFLSYASGITGWTTGHLKDLRSTEKRFSLSVRTDKLSYSHHRVLINTFPDASDEELKGWLDTAIEKEMPVEAFQKELRIAKRGGGAGAGGKGPKTEHNFIVTVPIAVWETLQKLSLCSSGIVQTPQDVATEILTEHCSDPEVQNVAEMYKGEAEQRTHEARSAAGYKSAIANDPLGLQR